MNKKKLLLYEKISNEEITNENNNASNLLEKLSTISSKTIMS